MQGTITDAERLVVEGTVEASSLNAQELQIAQGGVLKGQVEVEDAEISGMMDGVLTVKGTLVLRSSRVLSQILPTDPRRVILRRRFQRASMR